MARRPHFAKIIGPYAGMMSHPPWTKVEDALTAFVLITMNEINILRVAAGLPERTIEQLKTAMIDKMAELEAGASE